jgi:hypothetical protein
MGRCLPYGACGVPRWACPSPCGGCGHLAGIPVMRGGERVIVEQQEAPRRSDAGRARLSGRDVGGLILCGEHYAAQYDIRAPRGAALYRPFSGQGLEEMSLDLMANLRSER